MITQIDRLLNHNTGSRPPLSRITDSTSTSASYIRKTHIIAYFLVQLLNYEHPSSYLKYWWKEKSVASPQRWVLRSYLFKGNGEPLFQSKEETLSPLVGISQEL